MRIMNVASLQTKGGVEVIYADMCNALAGHQVDHFVMSSRINEEILRCINEVSAPPRFHNKWGALHLPRIPFLRQWRFESALKQARPDLLVGWNRLHDFPTLPKNLPFIHYEHGTSWYEHPQQEALAILQRADRIICASHAAKRMIELKWLKKSDDKIVVNRNAVPASRSHKQPRQESSQLRLAFAGRFHPVKAPWVVLQVLLKLKNATASFAGKGEQWEPTKKLAEQLGLTDRVRFLGHVSDMTAFYAEHDYLICPSVREPFGLVAVEAMLQGCIPLTTHVDGLSEALSGEQHRLCVPATLSMAEAVKLGHTGDLKHVTHVYDPSTDSLRGVLFPDPNQFAEKIAQLEAAPAEKKALQEKLQLRAQTEYSFTSFIERQRAIYEK